MNVVLVLFHPLDCARGESRSRGRQTVRCRGHFLGHAGFSRFLPVIFDEIRPSAARSPGSRANTSSAARYPVPASAAAAARAVPVALNSSK